MKKDHVASFTSSRAGFAHIEIIVAILLVAIIGIVVFVVGRNSRSPLVSQSYPTPEAGDFADWETYTNTELGISFKYPKRDPVETYLELVVFNVGELLVIGYEESEGFMDFSIRSDTSIEEILTSQDGATIESIETTKVDGREGTDVVYKLGEVQSAQQRYLYLDHGNDVFAINLNNHSELAKQILSTFQFIDPSKAEYPPLYPNVQWTSSSEQKACITGEELYRTINATVYTSEKVSEFPNDFITYYSDELTEIGWERTEIVGGHQEFWEKDGRCFSFGTDDIPGTSEYKMFVYYN